MIRLLTVSLLSSLLAFSAAPALAKDSAAEPMTKVEHVKTEKAVKAAPLAQININTASAEEIADVLKGIGPSKAKAIVAYREEHGAFKSVADLAQVKGIGSATLEKNKERILLK